MSSLTDIKKGIVIKYNNDPFVVVDAKFLRMQQRKPVMQTKLKNVRTGQVMEYSFKQGENVELADIARQRANFLYKEKDKFCFMEQENYEQYYLEPELVGDGAKFLKESQEVDLVVYEERVIGVQLPPKVNLKVVSAPPGVKGDTATGGVKAVTLETGAVINAPLFISEGETVKINTETGEYVERVNI